jgi:lipopolysaccharide transport system ATP-binding protein
MSRAIKTENISKFYRLGIIGTGTLGSDLKRWYARTRGKEDPFLRIGEVNDRTVKGESDVIWSLKDINFEVEQGEAIGVIGRNGAGKSTLLKILSRVTSPATGKVIGEGRVASLLEVGTGFHPELTGKENVFLNGAILGMRKNEIKSKFDAIVDFSGVERYINTPVKRYSSGMYVRLAFAVAAHLESEILIVDEVLAVGDAEFQKKCLSKMNDVSKGEGKTILFVSHNMDAISKLTSRCIVLDKGKIIFNGKTREAIHTYASLNINTNAVYENLEQTERPIIRKVELKTSLLNNVQMCGDPLEVIIELNTPKQIKNACLSFQISDFKDRNYVHLWVFDTDKPFCRASGIYKLVCKIPRLRLYMGNYFLKCYFTEPPGGEVFDTLENICPFEVVMYEMNRSYFQWQADTCGYIEDGSWTVEKKEYRSETIF